ncbi:MAG: RagB/SusD family nutrient uptake outer membrane protein [Marinoscillum sp.]
MKTKIVQRISSVVLMVIIVGCTDLSPELVSETTGDELLNDARARILNDITEAEGIIQPAYDGLYQFLGERNIYALTEGSTDEMVTPTRGTDWGDNGIWLALHQHKWTPDHFIVQNGWDDLRTGSARAYEAIDLLEKIAGDDQALLFELEPFIAEARFLRAYYSWHFIDLFGQTPVLDENLEEDLLQRGQAVEFVINELEEIVPILPDASSSTYGKVNRQTAQALLAKVYLNKHIYEDREVENSDLDKVIGFCDEVITSGNFQLASDYFAMFDQHNESSTETLLVLQNSGDFQRGFQAQTRALMTLHYYMNAGGVLEPWNGMCSTEDFFNKWDADKNLTNGVATSDSRFTDDRYFPTLALNLGFITGQQYKVNGDPLTDRKGNPLIITAEIESITQAKEYEGARVLKWAPDTDAAYQSWADNDIALLRYADVVLMKAEAMWRKGNSGGAMSILNNLRSVRGAANLTEVSAQTILDERGFELYWEGYRRTDLVRFGQFTQGTWFGKEVSAETYNLYSIPSVALSAFRKLKQNPGY